MNLWRNDQGYASIAAAGFSAAVIGLLILVSHGAGMLINVSRAQVAADLGAVAGAYALVVEGGETRACAVAADVVTQNGGEVVDCLVLGTDVVVTAEMGGQMSQARAGPL